MKRLLLLLLCIALLLTVTGCGKPTANSAELSVAEAALKSDFVCDDNYRVFYEIFVGSFSDSDGDGIGDLRGIINRMDYLNDGDPNSGRSLGVEGLWLTPIFASPSYHKYDVSDYYSIDPAFGTMDDLKELLELCHERNVKVILDLVINHTSSKIPWFINFRTAQQTGNTASKYYDYYSHCSDGEQIPGCSYAKLPGTNQYYECNFWDQMPELNYDNPSVRTAMLDVAKFYLDLGVDGFRFDAIKYIYFNDHNANAEFWQWYMDELRAYKPDIYTVGECWDADGVTDLYYPALNCFDFTASQSGGLFAETAQHGDVDRLTSYVDRYLERVEGLRSDAMLVPFLSNHDMDRSAGYLTVASGNMKVAANLYLLCPGSPFLYYGEELGLRGSRGGSDTDANRRLAMLWGDGDKVSNPEGATYPAAKQIETTVQDQIADKNSLYTYYKTLLMIRHANPEIARGEYTPLVFSDDRLGGFLSTWEGSTVCVIHNTTLRTITVDLREVTDLPLSLSSVIGMEDAQIDGTMLTVGGQTSVVLR